MFYRKLKQTKTEAGAAIEHAAAVWLQQQRLICIERNFRCKGGEIDLIMRDRSSLVFVEVRLRNRDDFGSAAESVTTAKQRRVIHAAQYYLATHTSHRDEACRFDVLAAKHVDGAIIWEWVRDAFCVG
jgi:putative endonuclease